jgi:hypothetical protein
MSCPACGERTVAFAVPPALREYAPESSAHAAICTSCLRTHAVDAVAADPSFETVHESFPAGEAGAALSLALGLLDALALRRDAIDDCCAYAERAGADVLLTLGRLAGDDGIDPHVDLERRRHQLAELLR